MTSKLENIAEQTFAKLGEGIITEPCRESWKKEVVSGAKRGRISSSGRPIGSHEAPPFASSLDKSQL